MTTQWLTTLPDPHVRVSPFNEDGGTHGWKLHAVEAEDHETLAATKKRRAACGLVPAHGWGLDPFIPDEPGYRCKRCVKRLGQ
jgi:hypothetical protein